MTEPASALPNAIGQLLGIRAMLGPSPAYFFDYDGTLSPLVEDPEISSMDASASHSLERLSEKNLVAVVSGRGTSDVQGRIGISNLIYAGSHGQEIVFPDGTRFENPESLDALEQLDHAAKDLSTALESLKGVYVERKRFAIAVHTRRAGSSGDRLSASIVADHVSDQYDRLEVRSGKEVHELRPSAQWHKGSAIEYLVMSQPNEVVPLFIGDDQTDEDGFAVVGALGGVGIVVSDPGDERLTFARYRLDSPSAVVEFLVLLEDY